MKSWEKLETETVFESRWVRVRKDKVRLENGVIIKDYYTVDTANAAAVVAVDREGFIILKEEYRHGTGCSMIEIPAGMFESGETDAEAVARRELMEETGYAGGNWIDMGDSIGDPARLTSHVRIFLALSCERAADPAPEETEVLRILRVPLKKAVDMVMNGEITCAMTAHAILKAARILETKQRN